MTELKINQLPKYDMSDIPTDCCPRFKPEGWDDKLLHFKDKLFVKVTTRSLFYFPINMGSVFKNVLNAIQDAHAVDMEQFLILSHDISPWKAEHFFAVTKEVPGQEVVHMNGDFMTHVFEGPYKEAPNWYKEMQHIVEKAGKKVEEIYLFYTTCPKCSKYYGKNYVVGFGKTG